MTTRILLALMITGIWLFVFLTGKVMPQVSSVFLIILFLIVYTWMLTVSNVHRKRMALKYPKPVNYDYLPRVCIVVPCHNEAPVIEKTVRTLMKLDYPDYELLVMDDRSTDQTAAVLASLLPEFEGRFRFHTRKPDATPGKSAVLNEALGLIDSSVICVFDADANVEPDFLRRMMPFLADDNVGAVQARKVIANADLNLLTKCQNYEYSLDSNKQCGREAVYGAVELRGNGQIIKRAALDEVGGWNENTVTDDLDLSTRLHLAGWDIRFAHKVLVFEDGVTTPRALFHQRHRWTEGMMMRYLEYAGQVLFSPQISWRVRMDMIAYLIQFLFPLWMLFDAFQLLNTALEGDVTRVRLITSLIILPVVGFFTNLEIVIAIIRFNRPPLLEAFRGAIITGAYIFTVWFPLALILTAQLLFRSRKRPIKWYKTEHHGSAS